MSRWSFVLLTLISGWMISCTERVHEPVESPGGLARSSLEALKQKEAQGSQSLNVEDDAPSVLNVQVLFPNVDTRNLISEPGDWESALNIEKVSTEHQIQILTPLFLGEFIPDGSESTTGFFIAWPQRLRGQNIQSAEFTHRVEKPDGGYILNHQSQDVFFDQEREMYYIASSQLTHSGYPSREVDPSHLQIIRLQLSLENGSQVVVRMQFKMCGPLPVLRSSLTVLIHQRSYGDWVDALRNDQSIDFVAESYENPTQRRLHFWVRASDLPSNSQLKTFVDFVEGADPVFGRPVRRQGRKTYLTSLKLGPLHVLRSSRGQRGEGQLERVHDGVPGQWLHLELGAFEKITLKWQLKRREGLREVQIPPQRLERVMVSHEVAALPIVPLHSQILRLQRRFIRGDRLDRDLQHLFHLREIQTHHTVGGTLFESSLPREIRIGYGFRNPEEWVEGTEWSLPRDLNTLRNYQTIAQPMDVYQFCSGNCSPSLEERDVFQGVFIR